MNDLEAYQLARRAMPSLTEAELHFALMIGRTETFYGQGWKGASAAGAGSKNWGAVQATKNWKGRTFQTTDTHADGSKYTGTFRVYETDEDAFRDMAGIALKPNVKDAVAAGNGTAGVFGMHDNGYFELAPDKYATRVRENYEAFLKKTGLGSVLQFPLVVPPGASEVPLPASSSSPLPGPSSTGAYVVSAEGNLPMLRYRTQGTAVVLWRLFLGLTPSVEFDVETDRKTRDFQKTVTLKDDGIVGPKTWGKYLEGLVS